MVPAADWRARCHQELRRHRPAQVVVTLDDDTKTYKPSGGERGRWSRLVEALPTDWERIELQDRDGAVLWGIDTPRDVTAAPGQLGRAAGPVDQVGALVRIMLQAQDVALARQGETVAKLQAGYERLAEVLTGRLTSLEQMVATCLQSVYDATLVAGEAHAMLRNQQSDGGPGGKAMEQLAQLVGLKMQARTPRVPNGHRPPASTPTDPLPGE